MKAKKNEKLQFEKNSGLYFVIGMLVVLALTYIALEWKSFEKKSDYLGKLDTPDLYVDEEMVFLKPPEPPKPKPIVTPPIIEIIEDSAEQDDTLFDIPEPDSDTEIPEPSEISFEEEDIPESLNFIVVEDKPVFPGCEDAMDKYACFQEMVQRHIRKNFKYPENAIDMGIQGKVYVGFTIQKDGSIDDFKLRGPHKLLEEEAMRIISRLPRMTPGKQRGTAVKVPFSVPINFVLQ